MDREFHLYENILFEGRWGYSGFHCQIIGLKPLHYMILDLSEEQLRVSHLGTDDRVGIRCIETPPCRFESKVLHIAEDPPLVILDYPDPQSIEETERRSSERKRFLFHATCLELENRPEQRALKGYVLDVTDSGCLILIDSASLFGDQLLLSFEIPWSGDQIRGKARVMHSKFTTRGIRSGVQFIEMDTESKDRLEAFIDSFKEG